jgi:hypothetical protein
LDTDGAYQDTNLAHNVDADDRYWENVDWKMHTITVTEEVIRQELVDQTAVTATTRKTRHVVPNALPRLVPAGARA